ncbi:MAG: hypothetical protein RL100_936 [Actinomycetota bacterium]|jgi:hypothetical protein
MNKIVGGIRAVTAGLIIWAIIWQITDRLANGLFRPTEYFAYFSIESSMIAAVVMAVSAATAFRGVSETKLLSIVRLSAATYYAVVSLVYNLLLRGMANDVRDGNYDWPVLPNEIIHVYAPIIVILDLLLSQSAVRVRLRAAWWVTLYPLAWLGFSVARGMADGWWPYWFIDPTGDGGVAGMLTYIAAITVFLVSVAFVFLLLQRLASKLVGGR